MDDDKDDVAQAKLLAIKMWWGVALWIAGFVLLLALMTYGV